MNESAKNEYIKYRLEKSIESLMMQSYWRKINGGTHV